MDIREVRPGPPPVVKIEGSRYGSCPILTPCVTPFYVEHSGSAPTKLAIDIVLPGISADVLEV